MLNRSVSQRLGTGTVRSCGGLRLTAAVLKTPKPRVLQIRSITIEALEKERVGRERVIILGCGWGGYAVARELSRKHYQPIIVSPRTYFVFTPLLASTAVGTLEFRTALESSHRLSGAHTIRGWANEIDVEGKKLRLKAAIQKGKDIVGGEDMEISWDKLVIAVGAFNQTFGIEGVKENAYFLKDIQDARAIRKRLIECFEEASLPTASEERKKELLNFAIVGGGPTGIEYSAELHDCINEDLSEAYPGLLDYVKITIYDIAPRILSGFDANLASYAEAIFRRRGITIATKHNVLRVEPDAIVTKEDGRVPVGMTVWSTGLAGNPFLQEGLRKMYHVENEKSDEAWEIKRTKSTVIVDNWLRVKATNASNTQTVSLPNVFALGDCAKLEDSKVRLPATAQVAAQEGTYLAKTLNAAAKQGKPVGQLPPFKFKDFGIMTYLGDWKAVAQTKKVDIKGRAAWLLWRMAYLTKSVSLRNKVLLLVYWFTNWILGRDINRF